MVGRTPELLGKPLGGTEMKLARPAMLIIPVVVLATAAGSMFVPSAAGAASERGAQGFSEIVYAAASATNGNGSAMAGLRASGPWYLNVLAWAMLAGRYLVIVPVLALAGALSGLPSRPATRATLLTNGPLFGGLLLAVTIVVGGLTFLPALVLGPVSAVLGN
jgi:K+-transporting ATPase ATPase A chain